MTHDFKPGDRVRLTENGGAIIGHEGVREFTVEALAGVTAVRLVGVDGPRGRFRFERVTPEFVVGQTVSGTDYEHLPVGSVADDHITKTSPEGWTWDLDGREWPSKEWHSPRTLTHLGDGTYTEPAAEPEDAEDAYVEDEPLADWEQALLDAVLAERKPPKEGDWVQVWAQVDKDGVPLVPTSSDGYVAIRWFRADAIVRPSAGQVPPWVKVARCTSLKRTTGKFALLWQCERDEHADGSHETPDLEWTTAEESGRIAESGAS